MCELADLKEFSAMPAKVNLEADRRRVKLCWLTSTGFARNWQAQAAVAILEHADLALRGLAVPFCTLGKR
jgi:hypothetical protein